MRAVPASLLAASACLLTNPAYDAATGATGGQSATTASSTDALATSLGEATTADTTDPGATSGATSGAMTSTTSALASSGPDSTGGALPGVYKVPARIGACVLVKTPDAAHGGPGECTANADEQANSPLTGHMMIDVEVTLEGGMSRPAHSYLRFDVPPELAGLTVAAATLRVRVADEVTDLPQSGALVRTAEFDETTLESAAPATEETLAPDMGAVSPGQWLEWSIPTALVEPGESLYLGLLPTDNKGVELRGATMPDAPHLELDMQ